MDIHMSTEGRKDLLKPNLKLQPTPRPIPIYSMVVTMVTTMDTMDTHMPIGMERGLLMLNQKLNPSLTLILTFSTGRIIIIHTTATHTILMDTTGENKSKCPQHFHSSPKSHLIHIITNNSPESESTTTFATSTDASLPACLP